MHPKKFNENNSIMICKFNVTYIDDLLSKYCFQINARTELALRYNDISPLENHHCSVAFEILEKKHCNLFRNLTKDDYKRLREGMIRCILATDMAKHNEILNSFKAVNQNFDSKNKEHKNLVSNILQYVIYTCIYIFYSKLYYKPVLIKHQVSEFFVCILCKVICLKK
ncbi:hypothetical protein KUTeg_001481 [Tegillarca granosa]|uniref:PDEase domain-containing protein n=1 Tax=Tegillarca granosa TaxID=220873 RepID=A0ABQ9FRK2_TEGGR|nr:hypothetical protein KUTeg_001481 [Tegillarca granosa]